MDIRDEIWPLALCQCSPHSDCCHRDYAHLKGLMCVFQNCDCKAFEAQEFFTGPDEVVDEGPTFFKKTQQIPVFGSTEYEQWLYGDGGYW